MTASDHLSGQFDYRGGHQPNWEEDPGAHEVDKVYPDYYEHPEYYHHMMPHRPEYGGYEVQNNRYHRETRSALMKARGNPNASMDVYRAAPPHVKSINQGDWVTPSPEYARVHAMQNDNPADDWPVLHARAPAKHLRATGDMITEFGYSGPTVKAKHL
jgi:hypothetical protein